MPDPFAAAFRSLRKAPRPGSPRTLNREPHKPLLLISVIDLVQSGLMPPDRITLSPELRELFEHSWAAVLPDTPVGNPATPFQHLEGDGFWTVGRDETTRLRVARLDADLGAALRDQPTAAALRELLIESHFAPDAAADLRARIETDESALAYAKQLLDQVVRDAPLSEPVRSQGFRVAVIRAYDYRCAICGVRIVKEDGRTVIEAAHIKPWARFYDDSTENGLALCRLCHWSFDEGMLAVDDAYVVLTSSRMNRDRNHPGILSVVANREIIKPAEKGLWPGRDRLAWHREHTFVK